MKKAALFAFMFSLSVALSLLAKVPEVGHSDLPALPINIYNLSVTDGKGHIVGDMIVQSSDSFASSDSLQVSMNMSNLAACENFITIIQVRDSSEENQYLALWENSLPINQTIQRTFSLPPNGTPGEYMILIHTWSGLESPEQLAREEALLISVKS